MNRNYQNELDSILEAQSSRNEKPRLLLHSCCAPCSSYVLNYLSRYFMITLYYFNPNIAPEAEYKKRLAEQIRLLNVLPVENEVTFLPEVYEPNLFYEAVLGLENEPEGGNRCLKCFELRLRATAIKAKSCGFDYFATTLSVSPHKNAEALNRIAEEIAEEIGVKTLPADFKKRDGYKRSIELSKRYDLYRQNYCGCIFSLKAQQDPIEPIKMS